MTRHIVRRASVLTSIDDMYRILVRMVSASSVLGGWLFTSLLLHLSVADVVGPCFGLDGPPFEGVP